MSALRAKDIDLLVKHLESEGARLQRTTKGYRVLGDNGMTVGFHMTASDSRATQNLRSDLRRMGHTWPWDPQRKKKDEAVAERAAEREYAAYVTDVKKRPTDRLIGAVRGALIRLKKDEVTAQEVHKEAGTGDLVTIIRTMYWLGWRYSGYTKVSGFARRTHLWKLDPEQDRAARETLPMQVLIQHTAEKPPIKKVPSREVAKVKAPAVPEPAPVPQQGEIISMFVGPVQPEPQVVRLEPSGNGEREVLDTYDSWAVPITPSISTKTVEEIMETLRAFGLQGEIRVWHEA